MMIAHVEEHFEKGCGRCARFATDACSTRLWETGLAELRATCRSVGLEEHAKWGHPCYMHAGRNIAVIGAFRGDFTLSFFDAALMTDPERVLTRAGPNTRHAGVLRFTSAEQVAGMAATIQSYLAEAMEHAALGRRPPRGDSLPDLPDDMAEALDADPELAEAFHALTPGRQRSYVINLDGAKKPQTRIRRIAGFRDRIIAGKGANER